MELAFIGVIALIVLVGAVVALVAVVVVVVGLRRRGGGATDSMAREEAMTGLGYSQASPTRWTRSIQGASMVFEELPTGDPLWTGPLPRTTPRPLPRVLRSRGRSVERPFDSGQPELDARFVMGSQLAARITALLGQVKLQRALLAMPNLSLSLGADELVIEDPGGAGLASLGKGGDAHLELHALVENVVNTLFGVLYTESGTVFDEYR